MITSKINLLLNAVKKNNNNHQTMLFGSLRFPFLPRVGRYVFSPRHGCSLTILHLYEMSIFAQGNAGCHASPAKGSAGIERPLVALVLLLSCGLELTSAAFRPWQAPVCVRRP